MSGVSSFRGRDDELSNAAAAAFNGRRQDGGAVSISNAVKRARIFLNGSTVPDDELRRAIERYAVTHGYNVHFDSGE